MPDRAAAAQRATIPLRPEPLLRLDVPPFLVPRAGAWQLVPEVYGAGDPRPDGCVPSVHGLWIRYRLRDPDTGETLDPVRPASSRSGGGSRSL